MNEMIIDTHANLDDELFAADLPEVLARARAAGVGEILAVGIDVPSAEAALAIAEAHPGIRVILGISPHSAKTFSPETLARIEELAGKDKVVGIGEIGLDFRPHLAPEEMQRKAFRAQLALADRRGLPVSLHVRIDDHEAVLAELREEAARRGAPVQGLVHCVTASAEVAERYGELGLALAFGGIATFPKAEAAREALAAVPDKRLLFETDCPYLAPQARRGKRCEPADIREVIELAAGLRGVSFADVARVTTANARRIFRLAHPGAPERVLVYPIREKLYVNLTNACTNRCRFCDRDEEWYVKGHVLRYDGPEPEASEFIPAIEAALGERKELVICGFGEPTIELAKLLGIARWAKERGLRVRVNTNGTGSLYHGRDIVPELVGAVDVLSVSLNTADPRQYREVCRPTLGKGDEAYAAVRDFIRRSAAAGIETSCTAVSFPEFDLAAVEKLARELGADFRERKPVPG